MRVLSPAFVALALTLPLAGMARADDFDKVNGDVHVAAGQHVGDASTVNGDVILERDAAADAVETVNGDVTLGDRASARSVETVNGEIALGAGTRVGKGVEAVNGGISLAHGAEVAGHLSNVNGRIRLDAAHVGNGLETVEGDIEVGADSHVEGGILVDKPHGWFHREHTPHIVIGPHAVVQGTLEFRHEVVLQVSDSAQIGPVKGATPVTFSGTTP